MKVLIVHAHENEQSYCSALKNAAHSFFQEQGDTVTVSDLYRMNFNPLASQADFKARSSNEYYKIQQEQLNAWKNDLYVDELKTEMRKFEQADVVNFNFPLWWFSLPALLKGWVDRVFAMGFAYGGGKGIYEAGVFKNKTAFLTLTTGGLEEFYREGGRNGDLTDILYPINRGILYFVGMKTLPPFVVFSAARMSQTEREEKLAAYRDYLSKLQTMVPLYG